MSTNTAYVDLAEVSSRAGELLRAKRLMDELGAKHPEIAALLPSLTASASEMQAALTVIGQEWREERERCDRENLLASSRLASLTVAGDLVHKRLNALLASGRA